MAEMPNSQEKKADLVKLKGKEKEKETEKETEMESN